MPTHPIGWTPVPRSQDKFLEGLEALKGHAYNLQDLILPQSKLCNEAIQYAQNHLPEPTFNHSMRVFYWGIALLRSHEPYGLKYSDELAEVFLLACMFHDIGTTPSNIEKSRMSFELWGAIEAHERLLELGASVDQVDLVAEVVNRHQDLGETGRVPAVLALLYFGTLLDNVGAHARLIHRKTMDVVHESYPRLAWSSCFAHTIERETTSKPWSHTTVIEHFANQVLANEVGKLYEE